MSQNETSSADTGAKPTTATGAKKAAAAAAGTTTPDETSTTPASDTSTTGASAAGAGDPVGDTSSSSEQYLTEPNAAQQKVAEGLRTAGEKVASLAGSEGVVGDIAGKASEGLKHASDWVSEQDAGAMLTETKSFVRRKPWVAAAIGVGALMVLNKLTRAITSGGKR
ncbi:hypothetical protein E4U02_06195 [Microbacterium paludicola]|uniref:Uncharacterized protein n=1 Tax=Microbacterium paludicola TaxID=300019 RepID=A0A4Y9FWD8_9MICO|nr:hypothetical protein [Microbacterium paludicola]MBF0815993.1 hypothetical protein [Microbacterium paludicola]TFU33315.1 hypothetical protein E4U02_06195 [Microbacterium paludicola]